MQHRKRIAIYRALRKLGVPRDEITLASKFNKDLHFDEKDWNCLLFLVESRLNISIDDAEIHPSDSIRDFVQLIEMGSQQKSFKS